jgi:hypothetical protein
MGAPSTAAATLLAASRNEIEHGGVVEMLGAYALNDWRDYSGAMHVINDYIALYERGEPPPDAEWQRALYELGDARRMVANNADVVIRQHIDQRVAHLASAKRELANLIAAIEDVERSEKQNEEASHALEWIMTLKDIAEFAEHPSFERAVEIAATRYSFDAALEHGVENLAQYYHLTVLAAHGVASIEELKSRLGNATHQVTAAAEALQTEYYLHSKAQEYYDWPAYH